jgi:uncharacterized protein (DUF58 family)
MITRKGVGLITVAIAVFFLASTTRVGWVHLADAVLWGVILLSLLTPWVSMPGMGVARTVSSTGEGEIGPTEGDDVPVSIELRNRWWLPRFLVSVSYPVEVSDAERIRKSVFLWSPPRSTASFESHLTLDRRGPHRLSDMTVEIAGPFGLFRRRRVIRAKHTVVAFPRWERLERLGALEATAGESEGRRKSRSGVDTSGTRAYAPGDSFRIIHWRNSARTGRLAVREFDTWNDRSLVLAIDAAHVYGDATGSTLDYAARIAASVARVVERESGSVSIVTGLTESPDFLAWIGVMSHLALMEKETGPGDLPTKISRLQPGQRLMAFVSANSAAEARSAMEAARRGVTVAAVVFDGFGEEGASGASVAATISQSGARVVVCRPGGLSAALTAIERGTPVNSATSRSGRPTASRTDAMGRAA